LREAFAVFLGERRFRRFVELLTGPEIFLGRPGTDWPPESLRPGSPKGLRHWQQQEWSRFTAAHPEFAVSPEELARVLRICEVHGRELLPDTVEVFHGCLDYAEEYIETRNRLFPNASSGAVSTEGAPCEDKRVVVWYCPACRAAEAEWESAQRLRWENACGRVSPPEATAGEEQPRN
jgi:hypothetical protein